MFSEKNIYASSLATAFSKHLVLVPVRNRIQGNMSICSNPLWLLLLLNCHKSDAKKCREKERWNTPLPLIKWQELKVSFQTAGALDSCAKYYLLP